MPNIKDVAGKTGLSVTTVSRVLNNRGYISDKTRKMVFDAMAELHYQPNELARSLFRQRSNIIGVIMPSVEHPFFAKLLQAIEWNASKAGLKIMCSRDTPCAPSTASRFALLAPQGTGPQRRQSTQRALALRYAVAVQRSSAPFTI